MQQLRGQLGRWEAAVSSESVAAFSSGTPALDRLLPGGGLRHGMLVEWIGGSSAPEAISNPSPPGRGQGEGEARYSNTPSPQPSPGGRGGAATLSLLAAREACREGGTLVVLDRQQTFYAPAAAAWGIDLDRLIVVRPRSARDELWAAVQSLRSPVVGAVWGTMNRLDSRAFRRLQLAAQAGRTLGLLLRPPSARGQPSWADVRLMSREQGAGSREFLSPRSLLHAPCRRVHIRVLRLHGGRAGGSATLEIDDAAYTVREVASQHDTHSLPVVSKLADSADRSRPARA
jgi:hypothetical protein